MKSTDRERVKELLSRAARLAPDERAAFIEQAADGDREIATEALELLQTLDDSAFMSAPTGAGVTATLVPAAALHEGPGTRIGRYKLLQLIGEGGFGSVFMAEQTEPVVRRVALKIIKAGMDTKQVIARFEAERQALALMDHPNIARVLDAGATDTGRPYFVMELVRGEPVTAYCDRERLSVNQRLELFRDVCLAVQHAHQKGIIHRDIKPSNVLVTVANSEPLPKVIDFGIAKATAGRLTDKTLFTELHQLIGTPQYMSPEQAEVSGVDIDTRCDVYALGVLLYELLAGSTPLESGRLRSAPLAEIQRLIREEEPPRPSLRLQTLAASSGGWHGQAQRGHVTAPDTEHARAAACPPGRGLGMPPGSSALDIADHRRSDPKSLLHLIRGDLDWIVMKCLEKDRRRRYATASALADDVGRYLAHQPVLATPPSASYKLRKFVRRNRGAVIAASIVILVLVAGVVGTSTGLVWALREQARAAEEARSAQEALHREAEQRKLADRRAEETKQVADFQAQMLADIDVEAMGRGLKERFREQVKRSLERQYVGEWPERHKRTDEEVAAQLQSFDKASAAAQAADVARHVMDEYVLTHAAEALPAQFSDQPLVQAQLHDAIGTAYQALGLYKAAEPHLKATLDIRQQELGAQHELVAQSQFSVASLMRDQGDFTAAEPLMREALAMVRRQFGDEHPQVANSLNKLADLLRLKGDYAAAEPLFREALALHRRLLGDEHKDVAMNLNDLGLVLHAKGDYAAAEPLFREALALHRKVLGNEHKDVAMNLNNLALVLQFKRDYAAAEPLFRESLALLRKLLGDEHPDVATGLGNLALLLRDKGDFTAAEPLLREALTLSRELLGDEHPDVARGLNNLAGALHHKGDYAAAESLYRESLVLCRKLLGDKHPHVAASLNNLATLQQDKGDYATAELLFREALAMRRELLGDEHPDVAVSLKNLAVLLQAKGDYAAAEPAYREALAMRRELLGDGHPDVARSLNDLAQLLGAKGDYAAAEPAYREALAMRRSLLGDSHPDVARNLNDLAELLRDQGDYAAAEPLLREALAIRDVSLPASHLSTAYTRTLLAGALVKLAADPAATLEVRTGRLGEAKRLLLAAQGPAEIGDKPPYRLIRWVYEGLAELYDAWHAAEPDQGHDAQVAEWRGKLAEWQASTQPTSPSDTPP